MAFKLLEIPVTAEMIEEENKVLKLSTQNYQLSGIFEKWRKMQEAFKTPQWIETMKKFGISIHDLIENLNIINRDVNSGSEFDSPEVK